MTTEFEASALSPLPRWRTQHLIQSYAAPKRASLIEYARRTYAGKRKRLLKQTRFLLRALGQYRLHDAWLQLLEAPELQPMVARQPLLAAKLQHRYVLNELNTAARLALACGHFNAFLHRISRVLVGAIYVGSGLRLATIETAAGAYELRLLHLPHCWQEGELSVALFHESALIGSATFVLAEAHDLSPSLPSDELVLTIGGIQGLHDGDGQNVFRAATKAMHGLRPFSLLLHAARAIARSFRATRVLAVADASHALRYKRSKGRIRLSYDAIWLDHGASAVGTCLFDLGTTTTSKDLADIPSQKRAQYRRRYALMESVDAEIRAVLATPR